MSRLSKVSRPAAVVLAAVLMVAALTACSGGSSPKAIPVGQLYSSGDRHASGAVTGSLFDGGKASLSAYRGKVLVLAFWADWCGPCTTEIPQLDAFYRESKAHGIDVLGINTKNPPLGSHGVAFVKQKDIRFPNVYDPDGAILLKLAPVAARALPATVLIDKSGRVAAVYSAPVTIPDLTPAVDKLAAEKS